MLKISIKHGGYYIKITVNKIYKQLINKYLIIKSGVLRFENSVQFVFIA